MTTIDWKALKPHIPLSPGDPEYVEHDGCAGDEIANWIRADRSPLLIGGPAGVGKSTELARAAVLLQPDRVACFVPLDRFENMRRLTVERMFLRIVQRVGYFAQKALLLRFSADLVSALDSVSVVLSSQPNATIEQEPRTLLKATLSEVGRLSKHGRVTLLIDGLEKVPQGPQSLDLFDGLGTLPDDVGLAVVIPWHAAFGPRAETVIRTGERFVAVRALDVQGLAGEPGREFLRKMLAQRLGLERDLEHAEGLIVDEAIRWSGGNPRTFLQLMAGAGLYATRRSGEPWPRNEDMADARADHIESVGRLFMPGDEAAIRAVVGTSGRELDLERKVRLLAHGILLERLRDGRPVLELHPLAEAALSDGGQRA